MVIPLHAPTRRLWTLRAMARGFLATLRERLHELAGCWRLAIARRQLAEIDDRTLRDLGLHRSEMVSCFAESAGFAPLTRRRIADLIDGRVGR